MNLFSFLRNKKNINCTDFIKRHFLLIYYLSKTIYTFSYTNENPLANLPRFSFHCLNEREAAFPIK